MLSAMPKLQPYKVMVHTVGKQDYEVAIYADTLEEAESWIKTVKARRDMVVETNSKSELAKHLANLEWEIIKLGGDKCE